MANGIFESGFDNTAPAGQNNLDLNPTGQAPAAAFPAKDMSTQGNAGFNAEGSYDTAGESNAYPESENM